MENNQYQTEGKWYQILKKQIRSKIATRYRTLGPTQNNLNQVVLRVSVDDRKNHESYS